MKQILLFSTLILCFTMSAQKLNKDQVYEKYLTKGAYRCSYFSPKYQKYLDSALVYLPKDPYLWQQKAMPCFKKKQYELGFEYLENSLKYDDEFDTYHSYNAFIKCIFQKNYKEAIVAFDVLISKYSKGVVMDHSYFFYNALSYLQLNKLDKAENNLKMSFQFYKESKLDLNPTELFYMGVIYYEREDYEASIKYFDESLKLYPHFSDALYYKAKCLYNLKEKDLALELLVSSRDFLSKGQTIAEANAFYEEYPYQIKKWMVDGLIEIIQK